MKGARVRDRHDVPGDMTIPPATGERGPVEILQYLLDEVDFPARREDVAEALSGVLLPVTRDAEAYIGVSEVIAGVPPRLYATGGELMSEVRRILDAQLERVRLEGAAPRGGGAWEEGRYQE